MSQQGGGWGCVGNRRRKRRGGASGEREGGACARSSSLCPRLPSSSLPPLSPLPSISGSPSSPPLPPSLRLRTPGRPLPRRPASRGWGSVVRDLTGRVGGRGREDAKIPPPPSRSPSSASSGLRPAPPPYRSPRADARVLAPPPGAASCAKHGGEWGTNKNTGGLNCHRRRGVRTCVPPSLSLSLAPPPPFPFGERAGGGRVRGGGGDPRGVWGRAQNGGSGPLVPLRAVAVEGSAGGENERGGRDAAAGRHSTRNTNPQGREGARGCWKGGRCSAGGASGARWAQGSE